MELIDGPMRAARTVGLGAAMKGVTYSSSTDDGRLLRSLPLLRNAHAQQRAA